MPDRTQTLSALCPAATALAGPPVGGPSIVCGVLRREGNSADGITEGEGHEHLTATADPSMVLGFCCGTAIPPATPEQAKGEAQANYCYCPIWQQEKERIWAEAERAWGISRPKELPPITSADDLIASLS
jgi:hypothetical protein